MRDLCLLSILDGKIAHFPEALQGICVVIKHMFYFRSHLCTYAFVNELQVDMHIMDCCVRMIVCK